MGGPRTCESFAAGTVGVSENAGLKPDKRRPDPEGVAAAGGAGPHRSGGLPPPRIPLQPFGASARQAGVGAPERGGPRGQLYRYRDLGTPSRVPIPPGGDLTQVEASVRDLVEGLRESIAEGRVRRTDLGRSRLPAPAWSRLTVRSGTEAGRSGASGALRSVMQEPWGDRSGPEQAGGRRSHSRAARG
jgi:hypothetical protein